jgi:iron complex outermembrane recepter protein
MGVHSPQRFARIAAVVSEVLRAFPLCAPGAIVCGPVALLEAPGALAQSAAPATLSADIPTQPLHQALAAFANQTGLQLVYVSGLVRNQKSRAAPAGLSLPEALTRLLRGTGLKFEYLTPRSIRILAATPLPLPMAIAAAGESQEVIVTASRRTESVQDVPMSIQVLTGATLARLNVQTFDDFVGYLPGVTAHGVGPAQNHILMRGLGGGESGVQGGAFGDVFPSVAIYLDEQSAQLPGRNLDVYTADLERIEVLEGPQGTLFGAGAEAGVLRYITNKPKLNVTEGLADAGAAATAHGSASYAVDAVLNLPLIPDHLAARAVIYDDRRGGYIDNIPGRFYRTADSLIVNYNGGVIPPNPVLNNHALVANDINPVTYQGTRLEALYQFNDDWSALIAQSYQSIEADGVFAEMAANAFGQPLPDLSVQLFNPSYDKDRFENTALTVNGHVGSLELLYAGSYLVRNVEDQQDYTAYSHGGLYADYYQCINFSGYSTYAYPKAQCFSPSGYWRDLVRNTHQSHELRLTTPDSWRLRGVAGLFYEDFTIHDQLDFYYRSSPVFTPLAPPTGYYLLNGQVVPPGTTGAMFVPGPATSNNPNVRPPNDVFFDDVTRGYKQRAAYVSLDFGLIPQVLTLTAGTRYYDTTDSEVGSTVYSEGCGPGPFGGPNPPDPCININARNLNALHLERSYSGFKSRVSLGWNPTDQSLIYSTWSQGYRPGVFNRAYAPPFPSPLHYEPTHPPRPGQEQSYLHGGWTAPIALAPDTLTNYEVGWKTSWFHERLQWNGDVYQENWDHVQTGALDQNVLGIVIVNGGNYRVKGLETSGQLRLGSALTIELGAAWNHSELVKEAVFLWADGTPIDFSTLPNPQNPKRPLSNPAGVRGSPLAGAPPLQANLRVRYDANFSGFNTFAQAGMGHQSHSLTTIDRLTLDAQGNSIYYGLPPFTTYNAALGLVRDAWLVQLYGENLTDTRAELYANHFQYYTGVTVRRPRTIGLRFSYRFSG